MSETGILEVFPGRFAFEDPWQVPPRVTAAPLSRSADGTSPRLTTEVVVYHDELRLYVLFRGRDDRLIATFTRHDQPLYQEDVVEVFLAPETLTEYFEIEVNPLGAMFDARIHSPHGHRSTMKVELGWDCAGAWNAILRDFSPGGEFEFRVTLAIPFASLHRRPPEEGELWRANFYRVDRGSHGDEYSAWRPTMRNPADFHVPAAFGTLRFRKGSIS